MSTRLRANRAILDALRSARRNAAALIDPDPDMGCVVAPEHKEAVRLYVATWILPQLDRAIAGMDPP